MELSKNLTKKFRRDKDTCNQLIKESSMDIYDKETINHMTIQE